MILESFRNSSQLNLLVILMEFKVVGNDIIIIFVLFAIILRRRYAVNKLAISGGLAVKSELLLQQNFYFGWSIYI